MKRILNFFILTICFCEITPALALDIPLTPASSSNFRFKDVLGQDFSNAYVTTYTYASASVVISLDTTSNNYLSGTVTATGLKPNFAYQIKLSGRPTKMATTAEELAAADDVTNERLGRLGRWWRQSPSPGNSTDADYDSNKDTVGYVFQGYLIIGFFVTDAQGSIQTPFTGNNSYHVLWRTDQRGLSVNDGPTLPVTLADTTGNSAYDVGLASRNALLYGEWEPTRLLPGKLQMPTGDYHAMVMLTEESFHDVTPLSGNWTAAMSAALNVTLPTSATVGPDGSVILPLTLEKVAAQINKTPRFADVVILSGTLSVDSSIDLKGLETQFLVLGVTRDMTLDSTNSRSKNTPAKGKTTNATVIFKRDRKSPQLVTFKLTIRKATLVLPTSSTTGAKTTVPVEVRLTLGGNHYTGIATVESHESANRFILKL